MSANLSRLSEWLYHQAKGFTVLIFVGLEVLFAGFLLPYMQLKMGDGSSAPKPLDLHFGFTAEEAHQFLNSLSANGRAAYLQVEAIVDIVYPLVYSTLFILAISYFFKRAFPSDFRYRILNLFPLITLLADFTENGGIISLLVSYPETNNVAASIANFGNYCKWISCIVVILLLLLGIGSWVTKLVSTKQNPSKS